MTQARSDPSPDISGSGAGASSTAPPPVRIERLDERDWARLRDLRITTLSTDPTAFGTRLEDEEQVAEEEWRRRVAGNRVLVAVVDGRDVGLSAVRPIEDDLRTLKVSWVWVASGLRGRQHGVSDALIRRCIGEARAAGAERLVLRVMTPNVRAQRLYARHGFRLTPVPAVEPAAPQPRTVEMVLPISGD